MYQFLVIRNRHISVHTLFSFGLATSSGKALLAVRHSYFEVLVMMTLLASSATLGIETHLNMQDIESVTRQLAVREGW